MEEWAESVTKLGQESQQSKFDVGGFENGMCAKQAFKPLRFDIFCVG